MTQSGTLNDQIQLLQSADETKIIQSLKDLQTILAGFKFKEQQKRVLEQLPIGLLFNCFQTNNIKQLELICKVMHKLFFIDDQDFRNLNNDQMKIIDMISQDDQLASFLELGWQHPSPLVRDLVVDQLSKLPKAGRQDTLLNRQQYAKILALAISDPELSISRRAHNTCVLLSNNENVVSFLYQPNSPFSTTIRDLYQSSHDDTIKMRIMELVVDMSLQSTHSFQVIKESNILMNLIHLINDPRASENVLELLNGMELIQQLASNQQGLLFLNENGALSTCVKLLLEHSEDPILSGFTLNLIASIVQSSPHQDDYISNQPSSSKIYEKLFLKLKSNSDVNVKIALKVIGILCSCSCHAFGQLVNQDHQLTSNGEAYLSLIERSSDIEIMVTFIHSLGELLHSNVIPSDDLKLLVDLLNVEILKGYQSLVSNLFDLLKDPFPEMRMAAYHLMDGLCKRVWGIEMLVRQHALFVDFVVNNATEITKELKEVKYSVVETLWETLLKSNDKNVMSGVDKAKIKIYLQRGPLYVHAEAAVAIATESR
ncbi:Psmd5 [Acrasis kona]|uniref:Psmd5 n=1 Tax=Acrasis kona TaxID=1008807 RepID=A0AAW2Z7R0_9EUKA